jgi:HEPN domain-containing protein
MSQAKNRHQAERWLATAEEDLQAVQALLDAKMYAQACFYAQQAGEKAVKALWYAIDADPWGHSVQRLIADFPRRDDLPGPGTWIAQAAALDKFYIPTRYPNGLPDLTPGQVYQRDEAEHGLQTARSLVAACRRWLEER